MPQISNFKFKTKGFTIIETLVAIGILIILVGIAVPAFRFWGREPDLAASAEEIVNTLRLAQSKTLASENASQWGVYFDNTVSPNQYTLFKGESYLTRDTAFDNVRKLSGGVEIYQVNLPGGAKEAVFNRLDGSTNQSGNIKIRLVAEPVKESAIFIDSSGRAVAGQELSPSLLPSPRDSRHVHLNYNADSRDALTLKLVWPDNPADNFNINFQSYLNAGKTEFLWEGIIEVGPAGSKTEQKLKIHTHILTDTLAQFSIHRDRRYNDKALWIFLTDNGLDEELIRYALDGALTKGQSIFVEDPVIQ